jgi:hypothetical protein
MRSTNKSSSDWPVLCIFFQLAAYLTWPGTTIALVSLEVAFPQGYFYQSSSVGTLFLFSTCAQPISVFYFWSPLTMSALLIRSLIFLLCFLLHSPWSYVGPYTFLKTLFWETISFISSFLFNIHVSAQKAKPEQLLIYTVSKLVVVRNI